MKSGKKIFWGSLFLLAAVAIIAGQLGYLKGFSFWSVLVSLGVLGVLLDGIRKCSAAAIAIPPVKLMPVPLSAASASGTGNTGRN